MNDNSCVLCIKRQNYKVCLVVLGIVVEITKLRFAALGGSRDDRKVH